MKTAIIGLPLVGKTSLFTILTGVASEARIGSMKARAGVTKIPDPRLDALAELFDPPKVTHAALEYVDMPALSKEALRDAGYIGSLRTVDAFAHVLRLFESDSVPHGAGALDARRDFENIEAELMINDLEVIEKRLARVEKDMQRIKDPDLPVERDLLVRCREALEEERPLRELELAPHEAKRLRGFQFLSEKPMLLVLNLGEGQAPELHAIEARYRGELTEGREKLALTAVCGAVEAEMAELAPEEAREYRESYGLAESGLERLIQASYDLLGLMSFLTAGETEVRAWTIPKNTPAVKAAGAIHSDFEKKFIRAEAIDWKKLVELGGYAKAREAGVLRLEGKAYIVRDGDVLVIRHG